jgi:hypothetical protein
VPQADGAIRDIGLQDDLGRTADFHEAHALINDKILGILGKHLLIPFCI